MTTLNLTFHNRQQAIALIKEQMLPFLANNLQADKRLECVVKPPKRTPPQNRRYWGKGVLAQIAEQATVGGKLYSAESWHEVFKQKFIGIEELPNGTVRGKSSAGLDKAKFSEFCTQVEAYAAGELGVTFYELERG